MIETLVAVSLMAILFGMGSLVYNSVAKQDQLDSEARKLEGVIYEARTKTINGFSLGSSASYNFGVYFGDNYYVLFPGLTYNVNETHNQKFPFASGVVFKEVSFANRSLVFEKINGQVRNFNPGQNFIILSDSRDNRERKISISQIGLAKTE